jgi:hypothetical protein
VHPGLILWHDSGVLAVSWDTVRLSLHIRSRTARDRAILGALTAISALAALFLGALLAG